MTMTERSSLGAGYFEDIFASDDDPWDLASSVYEADKFNRTRSVLSDRQYRSALEVGCAHGVLTQWILPYCDNLLAIDISERALALARDRLSDRCGLTLQRMAFPKKVPDRTDFDLVLLSEVVYYWNNADIDRASEWIMNNMVAGGTVLLVHYTGATDYPQTGDGAVEQLWRSVRSGFAPVLGERHADYRLDLWRRR